MMKPANESTTDDVVTDYHEAKRDLLRRAVERGTLTMSEIRAALPAPHLSPAELELLLYTCEALGVEVVED